MDSVVASLESKTGPHDADLELGDVTRGTRGVGSGSVSSVPHDSASAAAADSGEREAKEESGDLPVCRICLSSSEPLTLLEPCDCIGSVRYVHKHCLLTWITLRPAVAPADPSLNDQHVEDEGMGGDNSWATAALGAVNPSEQDLKQVCELCHARYRVSRVYRFAFHRKRCLSRASIWLFAEVLTCILFPLLATGIWAGLAGGSRVTQVNLFGPSARRGADDASALGPSTADLVATGVFTLAALLLAAPTVVAAIKRWRRVNSALDIVAPIPASLALFLPRLLALEQEDESDGEEADGVEEEEGGEAAGGRGLLLITADVSEGAWGRASESSSSSSAAAAAGAVGANQPRGRARKGGSARALRNASIRARLRGACRRAGRCVLWAGGCARDSPCCVCRWDDETEAEEEGVGEQAAMQAAGGGGAAGAEAAAWARQLRMREESRARAVAAAAAAPSFLPAAPALLPAPPGLPDDAVP